MIYMMFILLLTGCTAQEDRIRMKNNTGEKEAKAEELISTHEDVKKAVILLNDNDLLVALRMKTFSRFNKRKIGKKIEKELKKSYPDMTVTVSVDNKILLETTKIINENIQETNDKKIKKLKSLIKEET